MFEGNTWVYYLAIVLSGAGALVLNAGKAQYSLIDATNGSKTKRPAQVYLVAFVLVGYIVFWAAIRNGIVDTAEYIQSYQLRRTDVGLRDLFNDEKVDAPLFIFFQVVLKRLGFSWQGYLATIAIISGFFIFYGIGKYSDDVPFSYYLFITSMQFFWLFNGVRQFLVASIIFAGLRLIVEKKLLRFILLVAVLYFIHQTAWILIPVYFIANMRNWSYGIYACILATMAVVILFPNQFTQLLDDSFSDYNVAEKFAQDDGVNVLRFLVSMVTPVLAFVYKDKIAEFENPYVNVMVNMSLITAGLYAVGVVTSGVYMGRLPLYTDLWGMLLLPFILKRVLPKQTKGPIWIAALLFYFLYFYLQANMENGVYYTTNWFHNSMDLGGAQL